MPCLRGLVRLRVRFLDGLRGLLPIPIRLYGGLGLRLGVSRGLRF